MNKSELNINLTLSGCQVIDLVIVPSVTKNVIASTRSLVLYWWNDRQSLGINWTKCFKRIFFKSSLRANKAIISFFCAELCCRRWFWVCCVLAVLLLHCRCTAHTTIIGLEIGSCWGFIFLVRKGRFQKISFLEQTLKICFCT